MLVLILCFFIISFNFYSIGFFIKSQLDKENHYSFFDYFFIGLSVIGGFLNLWSLFLANNFLSFLILQILTISILFFYRKTIFKFSIPKKIFFWIFIILTFILISLSSLVPPKLFDSYLYHINAIQWNEKFGVVPGLANFHDRFGFNSSSFILGATYSFSKLFNQTLFVISSLTMFVFLVWLIKNIFYKTGSIVVISIFVFYYFFSQYLLDISSPGSDLLPNILILYLLLNFLFLKKENYPYLVYLIIPVFCITLKLSMLPIFILSVLEIVKKIKNKNFLIKSILLSALIFIPWLIRNVILTGYILFPFDSLDFFNFDWEVPKDKVIETKNWVYSWARLPFADSDLVMSKPFKEWIVIWWEIATIKQRRFYLFFSISLILVLISFVFRRKIKKELLIVSLISFIGILLWLKAPDIRFSFSFILIGISAFIFLFDKILSKNYINKISAFSLLISIYTLSFQCFKIFNEDYKLTDYLSYIILSKNVSEVKSENMAKFISKEYSTTDGDKIKLFGPHEKNFVRCFDEFPCTAYLNDSFILRGNDLKKGFKSSKK